MATCTICNGTGKCPYCKGTGDGKWNPHPARYGVDKETGKVACSTGGGSGSCVQCGGAGDDGED